MTNTITIDLPTDAEEAVRLLRHELRAAKRRLALARHDAGFAAFRLLAGMETSGVAATARTAPTIAMTHGVSAGIPR